MRTGCIAGRVKQNGFLLTVDTICRSENFPYYLLFARYPTSPAKRKCQISSRYLSCAYSVLACFRMGISESASFHSVRKS